MGFGVAGLARNVPVLYGWLRSGHARCVSAGEAMFGWFRLV